MKLEMFKSVDARSKRCGKLKWIFVISNLFCEYIGFQCLTLMHLSHFLRESA